MKAVVSVAIYALGCDVSLVAPFWGGRERGVGRKAGGCPVPYDQNLHADLVDIAAVWDLRVKFGEFADRLLPPVAHPVGEVQELIRAHGEKMFPGCTVVLVGSCHRQVHNKDFSDLDFHIEDPTGGLL